MTESDIDQRIKDLIGAHILGGRWTISQRAEFDNLSAKRVRQMLPRRRREK
jgi:hypothetical protein